MSLPRDQDDVLDIAPDESPILDALESYTQFIDELFDRPRSHSAAWEGNVRKVAVRSVGRLVSKWRHSQKENQPPLTLIVRLSRKLSELIDDICEQPRRILERRRSMEPVNRFRELDSSCIRWLVRQPGLTLIEKAGHKRQILAIQRFESVNTLENRVLIDLLGRCQKLAVEYLRQYENRFPNHAWILQAKRFKQICGHFLAVPELRQIRPITSLPQPNYVLLHEPRYHEIWLAYVQVIRQHHRRQALWQNRLSVWSEMCIVAIWSSLGRLSPRRNSERCKATRRCDLWITDSLKTGGFIDWSCIPSDWEISLGRYCAVTPADVVKVRFRDHDAPNGSIAIVTTQPGQDLISTIGVRVCLPGIEYESRGDDQNSVVLSFGSGRKLVEAPLDLLNDPGFFDSRIEELLSHA